MKFFFGPAESFYPEIETASVDLIFTDMPYGVTNCKWDKHIDIPLFWDNAWRILKGDGTIILFAASPFDKYLAMSQIQYYQYEWIWEKGAATGWFNAKKRPLVSHENILVFYKKLGYYDPQMQESDKLSHGATKKKVVADNCQIYNMNTQDVVYTPTKLRFPRSVIQYSKDTQKSSLHNTQKPLALCEYLVKTYSRSGDLVFDPFMGSGTIPLACRNLGRHCIGIEKDPEIYQCVIDRLQYSK